MKTLRVVTALAAIVLGLLQVPAPSAAQSVARNVVGVVKSYDSQTGNLTLQDGTTFVIPNDPAHQLPSGLNTPPFVGQTVRLTYSVQNGQRVVSSLEPENRPDTGERNS